MPFSLSSCDAAAGHRLVELRVFRVVLLVLLVLLPLLDVVSAGTAPR